MKNTVLSINDRAAYREGDAVLALFHPSRQKLDLLFQHLGSVEQLLFLLVGLASCVRHLSAEPAVDLTALKVQRGKHSELRDLSPRTSKISDLSPYHVRQAFSSERRDSSFFCTTLCSDLHKTEAADDNESVQCLSFIFFLLLTCWCFTFSFTHRTNLLIC